MKRSEALNFRTCGRRLSRLEVGFSLVELLAVIAIISILLTMGLVGVKNLAAGKGTTAAVASAEAMFEEARLAATSMGTTSVLLVSIDSANHGAESLRRIAVAYRPLDPATGVPDKTKWKLSSRGYLLPEGVYFSDQFSKLNEGGELPRLTLTGADNVSSAFQGEYRYYAFNSEGVAVANVDSAAGGSFEKASFVVGSGARPKSGNTYQSPVVTGNAKRDFGGFVLWRNGRTSLFRHPDQMEIPATVTTF